VPSVPALFQAPHQGHYSLYDPHTWRRAKTHLGVVSTMEVNPALLTSHIKFILNLFHPTFVFTKITSISIQSAYGFQLFTISSYINLITKLYHEASQAVP
jgi:hypothetical protein